MLPPAPGRNVGRAFSPAAEPCGTAGFPGRCKHCRPQAAFRNAKYEVPALSAEIVPCGTQGKALPCFAGHLRRKAAMHRLLSPAAQCQPLGKCRDPAAPVLRPAPVYDYSSHFGASQRRTGSRPACFAGSCGRPQKAVILRAGTELPAGTPPQPQLQTAGGPPVESTPAGRPVFELLYAAFPCCPASGGAFSPPAAQTPAERPPLRSR